MSHIKDTTRFYIIQGHNKSWASAKDLQDYLGELNGTTGEKGRDGEDGASAYQLAVESGFTGTVAQWLASLKGDRGEQGLRGPQGLQGVQGDQGARGEQGPQGVQGAIGPQGLQGLKGEKGDTGEQGPRGLQGEIGPQGIQGEQGVSGVQGPKGDTGNGFSLTEVYSSIAEMEADVSNPLILDNSFVLINSTDEDNGKLYVKDGGVYVYQSQLAGVKGDKGDQGPQGIQGLQGLKGDTGAKGDQGLQGLKGDKGDKGDQGIAGPQGIRGIQGIQGEQGLKGDKGDKGDVGPQGIQGPRGIQGPKGEDGVTSEPREYLFATRSSNQALTKSGDKVGFNSAISSRGIVYNTASDQFTLKAGKTYRITFTTSMMFANASGYVWFGLHDDAGTKLVDVSAVFISMNASSNEAYNQVLDVVYTPAENIEACVGVNNLNAAITTTVKGGFTTLVVQEI